MKHNKNKFLFLSRHSPWLCFVLILLSVSGCTMRNSVLKITDEDIQFFNGLLERQGEEVRFFPSFDGTELACTIVRPIGKPKGTILFIHGIGARANLYLPMADHFAKSGYTNYMLDIRGHGHSHGTPGHMPSKDAIDEDVLHFYNYVSSKESSDKPIIAMGHSLGTYIWIKALSKYDKIEIEGLVLIAGGSIDKLSEKNTVSSTKKYFKYINKWKAFLSLFDNDIKPIHIGFPQLPQLDHSGFVEDYGFSFFTMFRNAEEHFKIFYQETTKPLLIISGDEDELFPKEVIKATFGIIKNSKKSLILLEGKTHTSIIWHAGPHIENWISNIASYE